MLKCCMLLLFVGVVLAIPAVDLEKKLPPLALEEKLDNAPEAVPVDAVNPVALAGDIAASPDKPSTLEPTDEDKKEGLVPAEYGWGRGWGWGGYGRWNSGWNNGWNGWNGGWGGRGWNGGWGYRWAPKWGWGW